MLLKKSYQEIVYNYRYNYRTLHIDVSRETLYIEVYRDSIVSYTYTYNTYPLDMKNSSSRTIFFPSYI